MTHNKFKYAILFACSVLILFSESILAQSSPPLLSNDPGTPGPGNWEINILTSLERSNVNDEWQIPLFDFNYGVGERWQLTASIPFVISQEKGAGVKRSFNGIETRVKYRFVDNPGTTGSNFSFFPKVNFSFVEEKSTKWSLPVEWHREWSHFGLTAEVGHNWVNSESGCSVVGSRFSSCRMAHGTAGSPVWPARPNSLRRFHMGMVKNRFIDRVLRQEPARS